MRATVLVASASVGLAAAIAHADVVIINSYTTWSSALGGGDAKIDFIGQSGIISDQYSFLGANFLAGSTAAGTTGIGDGWGAFPTFPGGNKITIDFATIQYGVGLNPISVYKASLYYQGELLYSSGALNVSSGVFRGLLSTSGFDRVVFEPVGPGVGLIDNIYVGNPIPAPGVGLVLGLAAAQSIGRKRRRMG